MKITKADDMLTLTISKDMLKQAMGDGMEFELVYEALIKQIEENGSLSLSNNNSSSEESDDNLQLAMLQHQQVKGLRIFR